MYLWAHFDWDDQYLRSCAVGDERLSIRTLKNYHLVQSIHGLAGGRKMAGRLNSKLQISMQMRLKTKGKNKIKNNLLIYSQFMIK